MRKPWTQNEEQRNVATIPRYSADGRKAKYTDLLRWRSGGLELTSSTSTTSPRLTSCTKRLTAKDIVIKNMIFVRSDDPNPKAGPLWKREDYKTSASALMCLQQEQGKCVPHIPIQVRTRQHNTLDPTIQENVEWLGQNWQTYFSTPTSSSLSSWSQNSTWRTFSTVARVTTRRMARPKVVGEMVSEDNKRLMFTLASLRFVLFFVLCGRNPCGGDALVWVGFELLLRS